MVRVCNGRRDTQSHYPLPDQQSSLQHSEVVDPHAAGRQAGRTGISMHETTPTFLILAVGVSYAAAWLCSSLFSGPSSRVKSSRPRASSRTSEGDAAARQSVSDNWSDWLIESGSSSAHAKPGVVAQPPSTLQAGRVFREASGHRGMALPKGLPRTHPRRQSQWRHVARCAAEPFLQSRLWVLACPAPAHTPEPLPCGFTQGQAGTNSLKGRMHPSLQPKGRQRRASPSKEQCRTTLPQVGQH